MNRIARPLSRNSLGWTVPIVLVALCLAPLPSASAQQAADGEDLTLGVRLGPSPTTGVLVREVLPGSPADRAGIRSGDYILTVDGTKVDSREDLNREIARKKPGSTAKLEIWRNRQRQTVAVAFPKSGNPGHGSDRWHQYRPPSGAYPPGYRAGPVLVYPPRRPYYDPYGPRYYDPYGPRYDGRYAPYGRPGYGLQLGRFRLEYWD